MPEYQPRIIDGKKLCGVPIGSGEFCDHEMRAGDCNGMCSGHRFRMRRKIPVEQFETPLKIPMTQQASKPEATLHFSYEDSWKRFQNWLGIRKKRRAKIPKSAIGDVARYGYIGDLHVPFHNAEAVDAALTEMSRQKVKHLVIGGDLADCYSISRFLQYEHVPIQREALEVRQIIDHCSRSFATVEIVEGNHEMRELKYLAQRMPPELAQWFLEAGSFLARIAEDMPNVTVVRRNVADSAMNWLTPIGQDCIIGHPEKHSVILMRAVENFKVWLDNWGEAINIRRPRLVIAAHTHNAGLTWSGSTMVVEGGCLCKVPGYSLDAKLRYKYPQRLAYVIFEQRKGKTDLASVQLRYPDLEAR